MNRIFIFGDFAAADDEHIRSDVTCDDKVKL